jgi:glyoxylase-like metal-dependent hydrolase (beta-lactamase superfamily II)
MARRILEIGLLLAWLPCAARGDEPKPYFTQHELGKGVWAAVTVPRSGAGGNSGFVVGSEGIAVVDTFQTEAAAEALLAAIRKTTEQAVRFVIDTHYHFDHVAGNGVFARAGATVIAQHNVAAWERALNLRLFGDAIKPEQRAMVESLALPSLTYRDGVELSLGDRKVIVRVMPGHTGGDSVVIVPDADVVFTGDLFWSHCLPNLIDADTQEQIATNDALVKERPNASFVPGHGEVGKAADVAAFRGYLAALREDVSRARAAGKSGPALVDAVLPELKARYGAWGYFDHFVRHNVEQTDAELAGTKRRPVPAE